ncbi:MAG: XRE family transcriptional regulator [Pseudomonadota bacterium]|nr:ImmA/IrrE family metallo-endopeptidase [Pseudomonadota bacterium]MBU1569431.1 ImmA/IrrE family metallo-endopeptidase [Pseudomonadota bacterium]
MKTRTDLGKKIRKYRERLNLKQADLAGKMGFNSSEIISQIERGVREIKAWELVELTRHLQISVSEIIGDREPETGAVVLWRKSPETEKELKEAEFLKRYRQYALLEEMSGLRAGRTLPQKKVDPGTLNFQTADRIAMEIRKDLNLGDRPAGDLERVLQNDFGVKIWYLEMSEGSAASTYGPKGPAILMNAKEAPWRRNYNFAHELFHLITWKSLHPETISKTPGLWNNLEKIANAFASALLIPAEPVTVEFGRYLEGGKISYSDLIGIARDFGVSTEALLFRLLNLKKVTKASVDKMFQDPKFRNTDRSTMSAIWWQPPAIPERFVRLGFIANQKGRLSRAKLSEMLDTSLIDLPEVLQEYGLTDQEGFDAEMRAA